MTWKKYLTPIEMNRTRVNVGVRASRLLALDSEESADPMAPYMLDSYARENDSDISLVVLSCHVHYHQVVVPFEARCE